MEINDWFPKLGLQLWIDAAFESLNKPMDNPDQKTLFESKLISVTYSIVRKRNFDKYLLLILDRCKKGFRGVCVDRFF